MCAAQDYDPPLNSKHIEIQKQGSKEELLKYVSLWLESNGFEIDTIHNSLPFLTTKYRKFKSHISIFDFDFYDNKIIVGGWWLPARKESILLKKDFIKHFSTIENNFRSISAFKYMTDLSKELGANLKFTK